MNKKKYHYVYATTNLKNGKKYVGDHSTDNLNDGYLGSGVTLQLAIKKYKEKQFKKEILEFFNNKQEAFDAQEKWINEYDTLVPNGYNLSPKGGHQCKNSVSEETKRKISITTSKKLKGRKFSKEHKRNLSEAALKRKLSQDTKNKISKTLTGKKHTEESKQKMKEVRGGKSYEEIYGKKRAKQIKLKQREINLKEKNPMYGKEPWNKGKTSPNKGKKFYIDENGKKKLQR